MKRGESFALRLDFARTNPTIIQLIDQVFPASMGQYPNPVLMGKQGIGGLPKLKKLK